ncbi:hypothetical protein D3C81_1931350 [compost metagenome]
MPRVTMLSSRLTIQIRKYSLPVALKVMASRLGVVLLVSKSTGGFLTYWKQNKIRED